MYYDHESGVLTNVTARDPVPDWAATDAGCIVGWWSGRASWAAEWAPHREESLQSAPPRQEGAHAFLEHRERMGVVVQTEVRGRNDLQKENRVLQALPLTPHGRQSPRWGVADGQRGWLDVVGWRRRSTSF